MKSFIGLVTLLVGMCFPHDTLETEDAVERANDYVDKMLEHLRTEPYLMHKIEPLELPEFEVGGYFLRDVKLHGISNLYRDGDCSQADDGASVKIKCKMAVRGARVVANYKVKALFFWVRGELEAQLGHLVARFQLTSFRDKVHLDSFRITDLGDYTISKINGLSFLLNWLLKIIVNSLAQKTRSEITAALETNVATALRTELENFRSPNKA